MNIYDSKLWISDLNEIISKLPELDELANQSVMVTGCTGLVCSAVIDVFARWNEEHKRKIKILAAGRNEKKVQERFSPYFNEPWFSFVSFDASSMDNKLTLPCDFIIHGASNAAPNKIVKEPVETMFSNFLGLKCLLDSALENGTKRVLFISTSEVYGKKDHNKASKENEYGWIDPLNPRNSYSIAKCAAETMCASYYDEFGVESVIVRPGHIYGPTSTESDNRVASAWAYDVVRGKDIVMKSDGTQVRSYCYCLDNASAIIKVLLKGQSVKAYNVSNPDSIISIREMAEILSKAARVDVKMEQPTEIEKKGFNPMSNSSLNSEELLALGWRGLFDAFRGFSHTVEILKEIDNVGTEIGGQDA